MTPEHHRKIIHIEMDAFYAAVEQRDFPQYRNKPIVVGGSPDSRGVVATCSYEARRYGIHSYNKFLDKLASDRDKPDGFYLITPEQGPEFAAKLPISQFHGIGKVTAAKMQALCIETGNDLRRLSLIELQHHFGKAAAHYYDICRGIDHRPVNSHRITKSVGVETTFQQDLTSRQEILQHLQELLEKALQRAAEKQLAAYTLTVKIKYHNFVQITRSRTLPHTVTNALEDLIKNTGVGENSVRLLGVTLSSLDNKPIDKHFQQSDLFRDF